jgi:hypothetical protein
LQNPSLLKYKVAILDFPVTNTRLGASKPSDKQMWQSLRMKQHVPFEYQYQGE